ncbi:hypothetical protein AVEN_168599-1 [Araneus ventricosus]|uniref:Uncharacterized protein n=1 Tax=Araneus ventricosus TaxID=182803 RepID=A0A4Y2GVH8_ARAVE|nr:hypothetical protein AVEN_168599-1 [Araneus ventricosus]
MCASPPQNAIWHAVSIGPCARNGRKFVHCHASPSSSRCSGGAKKGRGTILCIQPSIEGALGVGQASVFLVRLSLSLPPLPRHRPVFIARLFLFAPASTAGTPKNRSSSDVSGM